MIGVYDFCGHYEWTFTWLEQKGGQEILHEYWDEAIHRDSQRHAAELIIKNGIQGMKEYWGHSLSQEGAGYRTTVTETTFRIDIHSCPSKGFLIRNGLNQHSDYCDHCIGWIGPMLLRAGFAIDHQHNHRGQCWWEMSSIASGKITVGQQQESQNRLYEHDVRLDANWKENETPIDTYLRSARLKRFP